MRLALVGGGRRLRALGKGWRRAVHGAGQPPSEAGAGEWRAAGASTPLAIPQGPWPSKPRELWVGCQV